MVCHGASIFSDRVDVVELAGHWLGKIRRVVERSLAARERHGAARFVDVSYYDLIRNPLAELARIYEVVGMAFDSDAQGRARETLRRQERHRFGRHRYRREDFGFTRDGIEEDMQLVDELKGHVKQRLAAHEYPREIEFISELPLTTTGKVRRVELRQRESQVD